MLEWIYGLAHDAAVLDHDIDMQIRGSSIIIKTVISVPPITGIHHPPSGDAAPVADQAVRASSMSGAELARLPRIVRTHQGRGLVEGGHSVDARISNCSCCAHWLSEVGLVPATAAARAYAA